ncbi:HNH endonuclease, partial [Ruthenibacterium lactatiformans]
KDVKMVDGKDISKNDLTSTLLETKPKNSPNPQKWLDKQGKISIDKQGVWSYTNDKGQTVKYPDGYPDFKGAGLVRQEVNIGKFKDYITDFKKADALAPNGPRNAVKNTWHHSQDGHTLQEVNKVIHKEFTHRGGMALKVMK